MKPGEDVVEEEVIKDEEIEEEKPKKEKRSVAVNADLDNLMYKEALKDVLAINETIPSEPDIKSPELKEFFAFKEECETLMKLLKPYIPDDKFDFLSDELDLKKAMEMVKRMIGLDGREEVIEGEPSPYVQELFKKLWQKYVDCRWFELMMRGKRPITPKELKYIPAPEDLIKAPGEKI